MKPLSSDIEKEVAWFATVLDHQFQSYFHPPENIVTSLVPEPPDLREGASYYARFINEYALNTNERIILMLALMPHIKPNLLDIFFTKNAHFDRSFTEFGGYTGKSHTGFIPTGETANFILNKGDLSGRFSLMQLLGPEHVFSKKEIVKLEKTDPHEPLLSGRLIVSEEFLHYLISGEQYAPQPSEVFPAKQITTELDWNDLVVSSHVHEEIDQIRLWIENEHKLAACPAFRKHVKPGFRSLFYGPPGTGKTLAACLLGKVTGLQVYRIDLSLVVSKYIGETEKNLSRIFDYAEKRNWILFFDEADALFGKRTQANSSNDRYANQEVSYLLQRVEDFPGVIILASNLKSNIDEAFARRFQSIIYFPMPDKHQRLTLWNQFFSGQIKTEPSVDLSSIAEKYELSGGSAINVFRSSAISAMSRNSLYVCQQDIEQGIRKEYQKYGRTI